ncbi:hypothetical protein, partial [Flavobacterium sp.]|uniref:hypothetical protein n=1 Tax=Flavobacterium sp. TaxID=239 RepID=UPI002FD8B700
MIKITKQKLNRPLFVISKPKKDYLILKLILLLFVTNVIQAQIYGDFPYGQTFLSGTQPSEVSLLVPQNNAANSATFTSEGLQLTPASNGRFGAVYVATKQFSSLNGIKIEFEYGMYGGSGADGICMFLFDASVGVPTIGANGGALGYSYNRANQTFSFARQTGLTGAYLGVGLDGFTNFKRSVFEANLRNNGVPNTTFTQQLSHVTLRGAKGVQIDASKGLGDGFTGYPTLTTKSTLSSSIGSATINPSTGLFTTGPGMSENFNLRTSALSWDPSNANYRKCYVELMPHPSGGFYVTVKIQHGSTISTVIDNYWYQTSYTYIENANPAVSDFEASNLQGPNTVHTLSTVPPALFKIGFGASTGGLNNIHLIRNLKVSLPFAAEAVADNAEFCYGETAEISPFLNDIAYTGSIAMGPTASSANIDPNSFQFVDSNGVAQGQNYFIQGVGTWVFNPATNKVSFNPVPGFNSTVSVQYNIKGLNPPFNDDAYRSQLATITAVYEDCSADLMVSKVVNINNPFVGDNVVFTIAVTNQGPLNATNVTVADLLPSGFNFINAIPSVETYNNSTGNWIIGNLSAGSAVTLTVEAQVNAVGNFVNTATVSGDEEDYVVSNNTASVAVYPVNVIDAVPDSNSTPVNGLTGGDAGINIFDNDTLNGQPV